MLPEKLTYLTKSGGKYQKALCTVRKNGAMAFNTEAQRLLEPWVDKHLVKRKDNAHYNNYVMRFRLAHNGTDDLYLIPNKTGDFFIAGYKEAENRAISSSWTVSVGAVWKALPGACDYKKTVPRYAVELHDDYICLRFIDNVPRNMRKRR